MIILHCVIYLSSIAASEFIILSEDNITPNLDINSKSPLKDPINLLSSNIEPPSLDYLDEPEPEPEIRQQMPFIDSNLGNAARETLENVIDDPYFNLLPLELMVSGRLVYLSEGFYMNTWENIYTSLVANRYTLEDWDNLKSFLDNQLRFLADYQNHYWNELINLHAQDYYVLYIGEHQDPISEQLYNISINIQGVIIPAMIEGSLARFIMSVPEYIYMPEYNLYLVDEETVELVRKTLTEMNSYMANMRNLNWFNRSGLSNISSDIFTYEWNERIKLFYESGLSSISSDVFICERDEIVELFENSGLNNISSSVFENDLNTDMVENEVDNFAENETDNAESQNIKLFEESGLNNIDLDIFK